MIYNSQLALHIKQYQISLFWISFNSLVRNLMKSMLFEETISKYFDLYERKMQVILMCILFIVINYVFNAIYL